MFKKIDPKEYIEKGLLSKTMKVKYYSKFARVKARQGKVGEQIVTVMQNGLVETKNVITLDETKEPGWIITNPSGEQYIIPNKTFITKYELDNSNSKLYKPKGGVIVAVKINEDVSFTAPWGEEMNIKKGGFLVCTDFSDIYGIQEKEFYETYKECNRNGVLLKDKKNKNKQQDKDLTL